MRQVRTEKANESEPLMKCRKRIDGIETGVQLLPREESGGYLFTALAVPGTKVARARFRRWCGTWERLAPIGPVGCWTGRREGELQAAETARGRVPTRGRRGGRLVGGGEAGDGGGGKGGGAPGLFGGETGGAGGGGGGEQ